MRSAIKKRFVNHHYLSWSLLAAVCLLASGSAFAQSTAFTYQGKLSESSNPANGQYDFQFKLYDTQTVGTGIQQGSSVSVGNVTVTAGLFTVQLDFGACASCFNGAPRFLELAVKPTSSGTFTTLGPRQAITSNPYAIRSLNAAAADGLSVACVSCVTSSQIQSVQGSQVTGAISVASVPGGSGNYIQNTTTQQATANFNISGDGSAGGTLSGSIISATSQYNIGSDRVLVVAGTGNLFAGVRAGLSNTAGQLNSFFGLNAGQRNTTGYNNSFFGWSAGYQNTTGAGNAFFGLNAGLSNSIENNNTFIGVSSNGATGITNATAIGFAAKVTQSNSLVLGSINGVNFATADTNVGIGTTAPSARLHVVGDGLVTGNLTVSGTVNANLSSNIVNATTQYNLNGSRVLSNAGTNNLFAGINAGTANTTGHNNAFFGRFTGPSNTIGSFNAFFGTYAGNANENGNDNAFFGLGAGTNNTAGSRNTFVGSGAGGSNTTGNDNTFIGGGANGAATITNATAIGAKATVTSSNSLVLGSINGVNFATADTNVGIGTTSPQAPFHLQRNGTPSDNWQSAQLRISGATDPNMQLNLGYDTTNNRGVIQAGQHTAAYKDLLLNPFGGNIGIGTTNPTAKLTFEGSITGNFSNPLAYFNNTNAAGNSGPTLRVAGNGNAVDGVFNVSSFGTGKIATFGSTAGGGEVANIDVNGNLAIAGNLSKGGGSFKIDHPLDPANKYLYHSFVESPDMMNIYNGVVMLNRRGEAIVTLPEWFESLNKDFRYQLTCIGRFAPVFIASEIKVNRFKIRGGRAGMKVSWQVTGIRHDAYANNHRIEVEAEKPPQERGKYLHPEAFNLGNASSGKKE